MQRGEQVLIGSAFHDGLDAFSERLAEAGIPHLVLDGRKSQKARGELAREFKAGPPRAVREGLTKKASIYPIMLAGVESMAELHNFYLCNNVILTAYSWAFDKFWQFISRAHRMTSPWPVNLWSLLCEGSIDPKLNDGVMEKKDASDLVLDGRLLGDDTTEVNLADLLDHAFKQFANIKVVDEDELAKGWPRLRANLCQSYHEWSTGTYTAPTPETDVEDVMIASTLPLWQQRFRRRRI
jgi:SNF2 family DNA or RNA helicase